jgi:NinB protein
MSDTVLCAGEVRRGRLRVLRANHCSAQLGTLREGPVEITIRRRYATRSQEQNRFYWGVLVDTLAQAMAGEGWTEDDTHKFLKAQFLPKRLAAIDRNGRIHGEYVVGGSTRRLTVGEFADYLRAIETWMVDELGLVLPEQG